MPLSESVCSKEAILYDKTSLSHIQCCCALKLDQLKRDPFIKVDSSCNGIFCTLETELMNVKNNQCWAVYLNKCFKAYNKG